MAEVSKSYYIRLEMSEFEDLMKGAELEFDIGSDGPGMPVCVSLAFPEALTMPELVVPDGVPGPDDDD